MSILMDSTIDIYTIDVILLELTRDIFDSTIPSTSFSSTAHNICRDKQFLVKITAMKIKAFLFWLSYGWNLFWLPSMVYISHNKNYNLSHVHSLTEIRSVRLTWNIKGSQIVIILLCPKHDLLPELGTGLLSRWRLRLTLLRSRVTRRASRLATLAQWKWRRRKKIFHMLDLCGQIFVPISHFHYVPVVKIWVFMGQTSSQDTWLWGHFECRIKNQLDCTVILWGREPFLGIHVTIVS